MANKEITTEQMQALYDAAVQGNTFRFGLTEPSVELMRLLHQNGGVGEVVRTLIEMIVVRDAVITGDSEAHHEE